VVIENRGPAGKHGQRGQPLLTTTLIRATASTTGLTNREVTDQLKAGKSLAQVAQSKGKTADTVISTVRTQLKQRLDKAVTNKRITQERANQELADYDKNAPTVMNDTTIGQKLTDAQDRRQKGAAIRVLIQATSDVTGLTPKEITAQLRDGKSLSQIAQSKGKTANDILARAKQISDARQQDLLTDAADLVNQTNPVAK
jgi:DNA-binding CsgD family transcriptional regulator